MKQTKRIFSLFICITLLLSLAGCQIKPTDDPTATQDPYKAERELYQQMRSPIDGASNLTLDIDTKKITSVGGETFTERTMQTAACTGVGTDTLQVYSNETVIYNESYTMSYEEVFTADTLYVRAKNSSRFCGTIAADEYIQRFPAILLDASLYSTITRDEGATVTELDFTDPTAAESWALPEGAELVEASGTATIRNNVLEKTSYHITYLYGSATITLEAKVSPKTDAEPISPPADAQSYTKLDFIDAVRYLGQATCYLMQPGKAGVTGTSTMFCQAAGTILSQTSSNYFQGTGANLIYKGNYTSNYLDLSTAETTIWTAEDIYLDGKYSYSENGEEADTSVLDAQTMATHCQSILFSGLVGIEYWEDVAAVDLGNVYLFECTYTDAIGDFLCDEVNNTFYGEPDYLDSFVSSFATNGLSGYFAIDKYTGLPTVAGFNLAGVQTIDGYPYVISYQSDQAINIPCLSAYKEITGKLPAETEPDSKATPLFYKVTGKDGQQMWLLGTIHVGDERTGFLPQEIYDAFNASDALALEYNPNAFEERLESDGALQEKIADYYYYSDGTTAQDHLDSELFAYAEQYMIATGNYNMNTPFLKPALWAQCIDDYLLRQCYELTYDQGVDNRLLTSAEEKGMKILDVEDSEEHVALPTTFSNALQELLLGSSLSYDLATYKQETSDLYEKWCQGDEAVLREFLATDEEALSDMTEEEKQLYEEYNTAMILDRNREMLEVAISYLESGETVFFAVGLTHLLVDEGLVDTLQNAGYTVELVTYSE